MNKVETQERLIGEIHRKFKIGRDYKEKLEEKWYLSIAYYLGQQWVSYNASARDFNVPPPPKWRVRLVANYIMPIVRSMVARLTYSKPALICMPGTNEEEDKNAARACESVLNYLWRHLDILSLTRDLVLWVVSCGTAFLKVYWDSSAGDIIDASMDGKPEYIRTGEVAVEIVPPFAVTIDPMATSFKQSDYLIEAHMVSKNKLKEIFGEKLFKGVSWERDEKVSMKPSFISKILGMFTGKTQPPEKEATSHVMVYEYYERPSLARPKGRKVFVSGDKVIEDVELPDGLWPYVDFHDVKVPGRFWSSSIIEHLIPMQLELNKTKSQIIEHKNLMAKGKWLCAEGSVKQNAITSEPGEVIEYNPNLPRPQQSQMTPLPNYVFEVMNRLSTDMQEVSGISEVSRGTVPGDVRSGRAIAYLQEADNTKLGPVVAGLERGLEDVGKKMLQLVEQRWDEPQTIKILGKNNQVEVIDFKGADVAGNYDVIVQGGSSMPQNKALRQDFIIQLYQYGLIQDPQKVLSLLEFGGIEDVYESDTLDKSAAKEEMEIMLQGGMVEAQMYEEHNIHMDVHVKFLKSNEGRNLPQNLHDGILQHIQQHQMFIQPPMEEGPEGPYQQPPAPEDIPAGFPEAPPPSGVNEMEERAMERLKDGQFM